MCSPYKCQECVVLDLSVKQVESVDPMPVWAMGSKQKGKNTETVKIYTSTKDACMSLNDPRAYSPACTGAVQRSSAWPENRVPALTCVLLMLLC